MSATNCVATTQLRPIGRPESWLSTDYVHFNVRLSTMAVSLRIVGKKVRNTPVLVRERCRWHCSESNIFCWRTIVTNLFYSAVPNLMPTCLQLCPTCATRVRMYNIIPRLLHRLEGETFTNPTRTSSCYVRDVSPVGRPSKQETLSQ
jgi:hypothetical protein